MTDWGTARPASNAYLNEALIPSASCQSEQAHVEPSLQVKRMGYGEGFR